MSAVVNWLNRGALEDVANPRNPNPKQVMIIVGTLMLLAALLLAQGCGGTAVQQHRQLNAVTTVAQPSYDLAVSSCDQAEGYVLSRPGTTAREDRVEIRRIRSACDRVFGAFEALIVAQRAARAAIDGGGQALVEAAWDEVDEAWAALRLALPEIDSLMRGGQ